MVIHRISTLTSEVLFEIDKPHRKKKISDHIIYDFHCLIIHFGDRDVTVTSHGDQPLRTWH